MFNQLERFLRKGGIKKYEEQLKAGPPMKQFNSTIEYNYDPEKKVLFHRYMVEDNNYNPVEVVTKKSLDELVRDKIERELRQNKRKITKELLSRTTTEALNIYASHLQKRINSLIEAYKQNEAVNERPYLGEYLRELIAFIEEELPESLVPKFQELERSMDRRGNPNFKKRAMSISVLKEIIQEANERLREEHEIYKGQNDETFLSHSLAIHLQEEFDIPNSTIRDNLQNKTKKIDGLFKLDDAYK